MENNLKYMDRQSHQYIISNILDQINKERLKHFLYAR